jgi:hypothetical protein
MWEGKITHRELRSHQRGWRGVQKYDWLSLRHKEIGWREANLW